MFSAAEQFKFRATGDYDTLDEAIRHARVAIEMAEVSTDSGGRDKAKLELVALLLQRTRKPGEDGATELAEATLVCNEIQNAFNGVQGRRTIKRLTTHALVLLAQGQPNWAAIKDMIEEAAEYDDRIIRRRGEDASIDQQDPAILAAWAEYRKTQAGGMQESLLDF